MIENVHSVWRPLVRPVVPWSGHYGSRHANCAQKETFQAPTDLNSRIFLNFEKKMRFLCKRAILWSHEELMVSHLCESVSCEIITILNKCNQSLEGKKNLLCRRLLRKKLPTGKFRAATARNPTEKRASSYTCSPCRVMFCLLKPIAWIFFDFAKAP